MRTLLTRIKELGLAGSVNAFFIHANRFYHSLRTVTAKEYCNPTDVELASIETRMRDMEILCNDFVVDEYEFEDFINLVGFPSNYHGGTGTGVYREKLQEHFVAWKFLSLDISFHTPYVDVAAGSSPWVLLLKNRGVDACAIDLSISPEFVPESCYLRQDATRTGFENESIGGASLQCAYEMFSDDQDITFMHELGRILKPGGRAVISPLYTHSKACYYQTQEYNGKVPGDPEAKRYVRRDCWGVPFSRKYCPETLKSRVWDVSHNAGLQPSLHVLRNKSEMGNDIYLHFILVIDKPVTLPQDNEMLI